MAKTRKQLIEENVGEVYTSARRWLRKNPKFLYLRDDLISHGHLRLIDVVDRYRKGKVNNLRAYLRLSLMCGFWDAVREDNMFRLRRQSDFKRLFIAEHQFPGQEFLDRLLASGWRQSIPVDTFEASEALAEACETDEDAILVSMLKVRRVSQKQAKKLNEVQLEQAEVAPIARELGMTPLEVQERAGQILNRFRRIFYEQRATDNIANPSRTAGRPS